MIRMTALAIFIALIVGGEDLWGGMQGGRLHLALTAAFVFGILCNYRPSRH